MSELESAMLTYLRDVHPEAHARHGSRPLIHGPDDWSIEWDGHADLNNECCALARFWRQARSASGIPVSGQK